MSKHDESAAYVPGRDKNGKFLPGNQVRKGLGSPESKSLASIRSLWYSMITEEDVMRVKEELFELARTAKSEDVKMRTLVYLSDRFLGKPTERVEMDMQGNTQGANINFNVLTVAEQDTLAQAAQIMAKAQSQAALPASPLVLNQSEAQISTQPISEKPS